MNADGFRAAEFLEISDGQKPHIRGVVPLLANSPVAPRRPAVFRQDLTQLAKGEVWKTDNTDVADAQDFVDDSGHVAHGLQRLGKHDAIKLLVGERPQSLVQVRLDHVQAAAHGSDDRLFVELNPNQATMVTLLETRQQAAPPTTQIEHARARWDQLHDAHIIDASLMKDTRRTQTVFRFATGRGTIGRRHDLVVQKCADQLTLTGDLVWQQEGIMPAVTLDITIADGGIVCDQGVDDVP